MIAVTVYDYSEYVGASMSTGANMQSSEQGNSEHRTTAGVHT
jgi:hypothetical protein